MQRIAVVLAAFNTVLLLAVGVFVVHGSARDGCAGANAAAALAWLSLAGAGDDEAAAEIAAAHAVDDTAHAAALATGELWTADVARRVEQRKLLRGVDGMRELAVRATRRAHGVCQ